MTTASTRLHITPLTPELLPAILGSEIGKLASNVSYHSLQTFPQNSYGYVDLPAMEAEKVKKKLNGAILKGKKVKVEEARPEKRKRMDKEVDQQQADDAETLARKLKKSKKEKDVLAGHQLPSDRKVKRGWTESKSEQSKKKKDKSESASKRQASSKYTEKDELLFRTKIPKNKASKKARDTKKDNKEAQDTIVHEFAQNTTVPSFLRNEVRGEPTATTYEDGKGWMDTEGNVIEPEDDKATKRRKAARKGIESDILEKRPKTVSKSRTLTPITPIAYGGGHSSSVSTSASSDESAAKATSGEKEIDSAPNDDDDDETSSSGSSGVSENHTESDAPATSDDSIGGDEETVATDTTPQMPDVHPLEALFKKPLKPASSRAAATFKDVAKLSLEVSTSFSFFESHDDKDGLPPMPMTPFTSQDLQTREVRSAAPTPDTAHPIRMADLYTRDDSEGELSEMEEGHDKDAPITQRQQSPSGGQRLELPQTDFEKQFWEKRGDNNRAWKARRRAVLKEKRQRDNRARRPRNW